MSRATRLNSGVRQADATATFARPNRTPSGVGVDFRQQVVAATSAPLDYAGMPGTAQAANGDLVVAYRRAEAHDLATGNPGVIEVTRSTDAGETWTTPVQIVDARPADVGDVYLTREAGDTRIYLTSWWTTASGTTSGLFVCYSDDNGVTWSATQAISGTTNYATGSAPRKTSRGWVWPIYRKVGSNWQSAMLLATGSDPLGGWNVQSIGYAPSGADATEWDIVEVTSSNWIAAIRGGGGATVGISQSTNQGNTWSAPVSLSTTFGNYDGWPTLRLAADGRVLMFVRGLSSIAGLRIVQCLDPTAPLAAGAWTEPGRAASIYAALDSPAGGFAGKFQPVRLGNVWVGAYMAETNGNNSAVVRLGRIDERALRGSWSWITTSEKIADGSTAATWTTLTTPDKVTVRSIGGLYKVRWNVRSFQVSGSVSNYQIGVSVDGAAPITTNPSYATIGGATVNTTSGYYDTREDVIYLAAGVHTITLQVRQDTTTVGRGFDQRFLSVEPFSG